MEHQNLEIAEIFNRYADLLEIDDANPFRVRAYRDAARTMSSQPRSMSDLLAANFDLAALPGIGKDLAAKIHVIARTGQLPDLVKLEARVPATLSELMRLPGLGAKRVRQIYKELGIHSHEDLLGAIRSGRLAALKGFGDKTARKIAGSLMRRLSQGKRMKLADAEQLVEPLVTYLRRAPETKLVEAAGSFRRRQETVGDLDLVIASADERAVMEHFSRYADIEEMIEQGDTRCSARLYSGVQVDVRVIPEASFGATLYYFTGSKAHTIAIRKIAIGKGLRVNEYGVYRGRRRIAGQTEAELFKSLGMGYIPPELREDRGEIDAALSGKLPVLLTQQDLRGDLHCHTHDTDGLNTLEEMAAEARLLGYEYLAITDHSRHLTVAHGMDAKRLLAQVRAIDKLNGKLQGLRLLKAVEVDILEDGTLDLPAAVLNELDVIVGAVHHKFDLPAERQTRRLLRAMDSPHLNIVAHPSSRLIGTRPPMAYDFEKVLRGAKERGCFLEVDSQPDRLDLDDIHCRAAKEFGLKVAVSSDAHSGKGLTSIRFGVDQARRGWLEPSDVINTLPLARLLAALKR